MSGKDAQIYLDRGKAHLDKFEYDKAIADFDEAIRLDDHLDLAYAMRGEAHYLRDDSDKAMADFDMAIKLNTACPGAYAIRGHLHYVNGEYSKAIADCNKAMELLEVDDSYGDMILYTRGHSYFHIVEYDKSIVEFDQLIEIHEAADGYEGLDEDEEADMVADLYFRRGEAYLKNGEFDKALSDYRKAIRTDPEYAQYVDRAVLDALLEQKVAHPEQDDSDQPEDVQVTRTPTVSDVSQSVNSLRSSKNTTNPAPRKRNRRSSSSSAAHMKTAMRDSEPAWAFFDGCVQGVLVVVGAIAYLFITITLIVYVSVWLFIPMLILLCLALTYMRYGKQWFIDKWNEEP